MAEERQPRQRVMKGEVFDLSVVQSPHQDVVASGHVVASSETRLADALCRGASSEPSVG